MDDTPTLLGEYHVLKIPSLSGSGFTVRISDILSAQSRLDEVAIVTPHKAPELLSTYNKAWLTCNDYIVGLTNERNKIEHALKVREATVLLDEAPSRLKSKGVSSSADTRAAIVALDSEVQRLSEMLETTRAVVALLQTKAQAFENAYTSVKKLLSDVTKWSVPNTATGEIPEQARVGLVPGVGEARY